MDHEKTKKSEHFGVNEDCGNVIKLRPPWGGFFVFPFEIFSIHEDTSSKVSCSSPLPSSFLKELTFLHDKIKTLDY